MNNTTIDTVNSTTSNDSSQLETTQNKQSAVTQRMIGLHRGRTRKGRFLKTFSALTLLCALVGTTYWVLLQFKEPDQTWGELLLYLLQRIAG